MAAAQAGDDRVGAAMSRTPITGGGRLRNSQGVSAQRASDDAVRTARTSPRASRRVSLTMPRERRRLGVHYDPDAFGAFSESIARYFGTARFLVYQSVFCVAWVLWNTFGPTGLRFDEWQFVGLTLLLSLQAAYAAPLILLAQNRQEERDRRQAETDRKLAERNQADTEFLAREIASVRLSLADMPNAGDLDDRLDDIGTRLSTALDDLSARLDELSARLDRGD